MWKMKEKCSTNSFVTFEKKHGTESNIQQSYVEYITKTKKIPRNETTQQRMANEKERERNIIFN